MDPESRNLLENTFEYARENNKMLHAIRRSQKWASFMRMLYWLIIIGLSVGAFYFMQPYISSMQGLINSSIEGINNINKMNKQAGDANAQFKNINLDQLNSLIKKP